MSQLDPNSALEVCQRGREWDIKKFAFSECSLRNYYLYVFKRRNLGRIIFKKLLLRIRKVPFFAPPPSYIRIFDFLHSSSYWHPLKFSGLNCLISGHFDEASPDASMVTCKHQTFQTSNIKNSKHQTSNISNIKHQTFQTSNIKNIKHQTFQTSNIEHVKHQTSSISNIKHFKHRTSNISNIKHQKHQTSNIQHVKHPTSNMSNIQHQTCQTSNIEHAKHSTLTMSNIGIYLR